jgi:hypothetical protein
MLFFNSKMQTCDVAFYIRSNNYKFKQQYAFESIDDAIQHTIFRFVYLIIYEYHVKRQKYSLIRDIQPFRYWDQSKYKGFLKELEFEVCFFNKYDSRSDDILVYCKKLSHYHNGFLGGYNTYTSYEYDGVITNIVSPKKNLKSELKAMKKLNVEKQIKIDNISVLWESMLLTYCFSQRDINVCLLESKSITICFS